MYVEARGAAVAGSVRPGCGISSTESDHYLTVDGQRCSQLSKVHRSCPTFCICTVGALSEDSTTASLAPYVGGATSSISSSPSIGDFTQGEGDGSMEDPVQCIEAAFVC